MDAEGASDEGFNYPRGDGLTLEKGRMVNLATGRESDYEELWHDPEPARDVEGSEGKAVTLVLMWEGGREQEQEEEHQRGMVVRVGEWCQGLVRDGEGIACERWQWSRAEGDWRMRARICANGMEGLVPCQEAIGKRWAVGDEVVKASRTWRVVESDVA
ncbi:hypothetical protein ESCO_006331 [Escovopsis weberi]|uniref:Protein HRI1 n=1 Tax=Escovopsis weberi TaxID=150374 RepID=A0A0M8N468_ESCWE|nr:hypothetical protein ESCO_006331 [Escovopsis weberi]